MLAKNNLVLNNFNLAPCFKISFDLYLEPSGPNHLYHSILQVIGNFADGINNGEQGTKCSDRFPAMGAQMMEDNAILRFDFCVNEGLISKSNREIENIYIDFGQTYKIEIGQKYNSQTGELNFYVTIDGPERINVPNRYPRVFKNLDLYAGNHWDQNAIGNMKNFIITSEDCFQRSQILTSTTTFWQSPMASGFEFEDWPSAQVYYQHFTEPKDPSTASARCKTYRDQTNFPIYLPGPENDDENNNLRFIMNKFQLQNTWLGIQRSSENTDDWFHEKNPINKQKYFNWKKATDGSLLEPNNADGIETNVVAKVIEINSLEELVWNDGPPAWTHPFICLAKVRGLSKIRISSLRVKLQVHQIKVFLQIPPCISPILVLLTLKLSSTIQEQSS